MLVVIDHLDICNSKLHTIKQSTIIHQNFNRNNYNYLEPDRNVKITFYRRKSITLRPVRSNFRQPLLFRIVTTAFPKINVYFEPLVPQKPFLNHQLHNTPTTRGAQFTNRVVSNDCAKFTRRKNTSDGESSNVRAHQNNIRCDDRSDKNATFQLVCPAFERNVRCPWLSRRSRRNLVKEQPRRVFVIVLVVTNSLSLHRDCSENIASTYHAYL